MGLHTRRRLWLLIGCATFILFVFNRKNHDQSWDTSAYLESMFEHARLYPPRLPPHRKLQFGLLETVRTHCLEPLPRFNSWPKPFPYFQDLKSRHPLLDLIKEGERKWESMIARCATT